MLFFTMYRRKLLRRITPIVAITIAGCAHSHNPGTTRTAAADPGKTRFETYCAGCHLDEGPFARGQAPPLEESEWIAGAEDRVIKIALHGLHGPIQVAGKPYNQEMPGFAPVLKDAEIASLLTYARKRFGAVDRPVSDAAVAAIRNAYPDRKKYWTVEEFLRTP